MSQNPLGAYVAKNPSNILVPLTTDANGNLFIGTGSIGKSNITTPIVIKASSGRLVKIVVNTVATGGVLSAHDCATTGAAAAANQIIGIGAAWPAAGTVIPLDWPCAAGIVVDPGTGGNVSVSFD
jgi:hypothetical protein